MTFVVEVILLRFKVDTYPKTIIILFPFATHPKIPSKYIPLWKDKNIARWMSNEFKIR